MWPKNPETVSLKIQLGSQPELMDGQRAITGQVLQIDENYPAHHSHLHLYYTVLGRDNIILDTRLSYVRLYFHLCVRLRVTSWIQQRFGMVMFFPIQKKLPPHQGITMIPPCGTLGPPKLLLDILNFLKGPTYSPQLRMSVLNCKDTLFVV